MKRIMIVGGHSGDEAIMAGPIAARVVREGGSAVFVAMTNGDAGHPTLGRAEYAVQKDREAEAAAAALGAECVLFPISSREIDWSPERADELATLIRRYRPDTVITHWRDSIHRDHTATHHNTVTAIRRAADRSYADGQETHFVEALYFAENWEDTENFRAEEYVSFTEEDEARWLTACREFQFFREGFYDFDYTTFYTSLHRVRGALARRSGGTTPLAVALMRNPKSYYAIKTL